MRHLTRFLPGRLPRDLRQPPPFAPRACVVSPQTRYRQKPSRRSSSYQLLEFLPLHSFDGR